MAVEVMTDSVTRDQVGSLAYLSPEAYLRRDHPLRFERGGVVYAVDGRVGVLRQIVVDQDAGQVTELVVLRDGTKEAVVVPVSLVAKTGGSAVVLSVGKSQLTDGVVETPRYEKRHFRKVSLRALRRSGKEATARSLRLAVLDVNKDAVTTPSVTRLGDGVIDAS